MKNRFTHKVFRTCVLILLVAPLGLSAQKTDFGNWLIYFGNKKIDSKWNWHHELQLRNYNAIGDLEQLLLRTGIGYNLTENNNNLMMGYGFIHSQNYIGNTDDKTKVDEHRLFQQFITRQSFGRMKVQHRYRFEQRWIGDDFKTRFRYFLSLNLALQKQASASKGAYLSAYNEIFLNTRGTIFDRNRLYGGVGYQVNKDLRFELAYMNQFLNGGKRDQVNMVVFFSF